MRPEAANYTLDGRGYHGGMAEFFPRMNVGYVQFNNGDGNGPDGVMKRYGSVGVGPGVQGNTCCRLASFMKPVHQCSFVVALAKIDGDAQRFAKLLAISLDIRQCLATINSWLTFSECIQIWAVHHENCSAHRLSRRVFDRIPIDR